MTGPHRYKTRLTAGGFVIDKLLKQASVVDVKSNFVLERVKGTTALPVAVAVTPAVRLRKW